MMAKQPRVWSKPYVCCRGSPCILPEETLAGYQAAADQGVDYLEMDAVRARALSPIDSQH